MLYENTKRGERGSLEGLVLTTIEQQAYFNGLLEMALKQLHDPKKAEKVGQDTQEMQQGLHRILSFLRINMRGANNAKPDWIISQVQTLLGALPKEQRLKLLEEMLEKENQDVRTQ
jgi:stress response protein YsnF